jgi:uncharacterized membrane protein
MEESINLKQIKILGGVGSILSLLGGMVPVVGFLLFLSGFIMVLVAIFKIEKVFKEKGIFSKFLIGYLFFWLFGFFLIVLILWGSLIPEWGEKPEALLQFIPLFLFSGWVLVIVGSYLIKKSYDKISSITKEKKFALAGFFNFIRPISWIVVYFIFAHFGTTYDLDILGPLFQVIIVDFILSFVSQIFAILAFFSLPDELKREIEKEKVA